jgi:hypothetical protein
MHVVMMHFQIIVKAQRRTDGIAVGLVMGGDDDLSGKVQKIFKIPDIIFRETVVHGSQKYEKIKTLY